MGKSNETERGIQMLTVTKIFIAASFKQSLGYVKTYSSAKSLPAQAVSRFVQSV